MLNKYNQKVISILGTMTIVVFSIVIIIAGYNLISELFPNNNYSVETGMTLEEEVSESGIKQRDQEISVDLPVRIDSARQIFVIPISQVNLEESEDIGGILGIMETSRTLNVGGYDKYGGFRDSYNNLVVHDYLKNSLQVVFQSKVLIQNFTFEQFDNKPFIIIKGVEVDSNKDKKLNFDDLQSLYIYDVLSSKLHSFSIENAGVTSFKRLYESNDIVVSYTLDKNRNGLINNSKEPSRVKIISLKDFSIKSIVDPATLNRIQSLVD